jgi:hypothetical protein
MVVIVSPEAQYQHTSILSTSSDNMERMLWHFLLQYKVQAHTTGSEVIRMTICFPYVRQKCCSSVVARKAA